MINAEDFLAEAQSLVNTTSVGEVRCRTIASRSYYAAYHLALVVARQHGFVYRHGEGYGSHAALLQFLAAHPDLEDLCEDLVTLKARRVIADYRLGESVLPQDVKDTLRIAAAIVESLKAEAA